MTGELAAGEQLRQRDLAQRFQVSQTPVREAMRRLESEGLVIGDTHRGFTVVAPDDGPADENFQIRAALESLGASLAARKIDAAGLARLKELNDQMRALGAAPSGQGDARYAGESAVSFHRVRVRPQPAAAVDDAAAVGFPARRTQSRPHARGVRPPARRDPGRAPGGRSRGRGGRHVPAHHGESVTMTRTGTVTTGIITRGGASPHAGSRGRGAAGPGAWAAGPGAWAARHPLSLPATSAGVPG